MLKWLLITVVILSGGVLGYLYYQLRTTETGTSALQAAAKPEGVRIVHSFKDGVHRIAGQVRLPHSCFSVDAYIAPDKETPEKEIISATAVDISSPAKTCSKFPTNYPFELLAEGGENMTFSFMLNGNELPIRIIETDWQSATGIYLNTLDNRFIQ